MQYTYRIYKAERDSTQNESAFSREILVNLRSKELQERSESKYRNWFNTWNLKYGLELKGIQII